VTHIRIGFTSGGKQMRSQLSKDQIKAVVEEIHQTQFIRTMRSHPWVPEDGAYDFEDHGTRLFIHEGFAYYIASKTWVEDQIANKRLPEWMRAPWGSYPELPPKPPKK
jgi:hypothetical protein